VGVRGTTHWEDPQVLACKKNKKKSAEKKQNKKYIAINITKAHGVADTCI